MIFDLCYHPYYPCLYAFWYSIPTFLSIFCNCFLYLLICKSKNQQDCISNIGTFMKSEKTLDDTACMDSMFTMSIHTPCRYILELLLIQSAHTFLGSSKAQYQN